LILVDTSVWVDHLRRGDSRLVALLDAGSVIVHPFVIGEIACGSLANRKIVIELLQAMPPSAVADDDEVLVFMEHRGLHGKGLGYVDVHLLAAVALTSGARLWTRDKRLRAAAEVFGCAHEEARPH
jgi:predicted nucleic acid-binding protein